MEIEELVERHEPEFQLGTTQKTELNEQAVVSGNIPVLAGTGASPNFVYGSGTIGQNIVVVYTPYYGLNGIKAYYPIPKGSTMKLPILQFSSIPNSAPPLARTLLLQPVNGTGASLYPGFDLTMQQNLLSNGTFVSERMNGVSLKLQTNGTSTTQFALSGSISYGLIAHLPTLTQFTPDEVSSYASTPKESVNSIPAGQGVEIAEAYAYPSYDIVNSAPTSGLASSVGIDDGTRYWTKVDPSMAEFFSCNLPFVSSATTTGTLNTLFVTPYYASASTSVTGNVQVVQCQSVSPSQAVVIEAKVFQTYQTASPPTSTSFGNVSFYHLYAAVDMSTPSAATTIYYAKSDAAPVVFAGATCPDAQSYGPTGVINGTGLYLKLAGEDCRCQSIAPYIAPFVWIGTMITGFSEAIPSGPSTVLPSITQLNVRQLANPPLKSHVFVMNQLATGQQLVVNGKANIATVPDLLPYRRTMEYNASGGRVFPLNAGGTNATQGAIEAEAADAQQRKRRREQSMMRR